MRHVPSHALILSVALLLAAGGPWLRAADTTQSATPSPVTIETLLSTPYPTEIVAAPSGGRIAWIANDEGRSNIWTAAPPSFAAVQITRYTEDDGQHLSDLAWTGDGRALVFVRGDGANRQGDSPNPAQLQAAVEQAVFIVAEGGTPRRLGAGSGIAASPIGQRIAWVSRGQVWSVDAATTAEAQQLVRARGGASNLVWSPNGAMLGFTSQRGTHSYVGVFTMATRALRFIDPSLDRDDHVVWSPDSTRMAWVRVAAAPRPRMFSPRRTADEPWSIRTADVTSGLAREVWKADAGYGSVFQTLETASQLLWGAGDRLVFAWEKGGWHRLHSVAVSGGPATVLTPGDGEVEHTALSPDRSRVVYNSNHADIDRRRIWSVPVAGDAAPTPITKTGISWQPVVTSDQSVAAIHADAKVPPAVVVVNTAGTTTSITETMPPATYPLTAMVEPQAVTVTATDGMAIPAQLFLPRDLKAGERRPGLIFFHGGSRRQMLLGWHYRDYYRNTYAANQWLASKGYVVLSVNYRSGTGYGLEFREAPNYGATGGAEFQDVMGAGLYMKGRPDVDPARIGIWGGSYGGYLTAMALSRASDLFAAGVDIHGVHDWNQGIRTFLPDYNVHDDPEFARRAFDASPLAKVGDWRSPVLLIHGDDDRNVSFIESINLITELRKRRVDVEQLVLPDEIHGFLRHASWMRVLNSLGDFFDRKLKVAQPRTVAR